MTAPVESSAAPSTSPAPAAGDPVWIRAIGVTVFLAAVVIGGWLRFHDLGLKPLHSDEGVNGWFLMRLYNGLRDFGNWQMNYKYDPSNYHGPFLYFAGLLPFFAAGPSEVSLRALMAIAGTGCIAILWAARRWLGWAGLGFAAWLFALSPPLIYFSRTAIHEIYVACFSLAAVICLSRCYAGSWKPGASSFRPNWLLFGVVSAGLVFTNKETAVITFGSFAGAMAVAWFFSRTSPAEDVAAPATSGKKKRKEKEAGSTSGLQPSAKLLRLILALAIALGPPAILFVLAGDAKKKGDAASTSQSTWIAVSAVFGVASAAAWLAGTRAEPFLTGPRLRRLREIGRYATGGVFFCLVGPVFLARTVADRVPFLAGIRPRLAAFADRVEKRLPGPFEDLSDYALAYAWTLAIVLILFTSFFNNLKGAGDMFVAYAWWVGRGHEGAGHDKPFGYWIDLLWTFDAPILIAGMLGTVAALFRRDRFGLFVASWAWSQWLVYSVISYKTPWLNLNFTVPLAVTGGIAVRELARGLDARMLGGRGIAGAALCALAPIAVAFWPVPAGPVLAPKDPEASVPWWKLGWDVNFVHYDDDRYGIIYVQTVREYEELIAHITTLLEKDPTVGVWVTSSDYWPMPFNLRDWDKTVGYHQGKIPTGTTPTVVVSSSSQESDLRERVAGYRRVPFMLRPGIALSLFVEPSVYDAAFGPPVGEAPPEPPPSDPSLLAPGVLAEYRYGIGCTGEVLARRVDPAPRYGPVDREFRAPLCASWRGFVKIEEAGEYAFGTNSDDGSWVYLDGTLAADNGGTHGPTDREGVLRSLTPGLHAIEVRYFDAGGGATLRGWIRKRDGRRQWLDEASGLLFHDDRWRAAAPGSRAVGP